MTLPKSGAAEWAAAQATPWLTVNATFRALDQGAMYYVVKDKDLATPPGSPADGDAYIVAASPTGAWTGHAKDIAYYSSGWLFRTPIEGVAAWVQDEHLLYYYDGSAWASYATAGAGALLIANNLSDVANAATARTNLGATTVGGNIFTLTNPSAITFLRMNADNSVSALSASAFRTAIGAGTGSGSGDMLAANNLSDVANAGTSRTNLGLGAGDSPQFTAVNIGHASDTTITRTGAGDIAVEGNAVYRAGGTDVPVTDGGTGASTAAAARTNLGIDDIRVSFFFTSIPTASEVLALYIASDAFTIPANFGTPNSVGVIGTNPTASFAIDVTRQVNATGSFTTIGTITISTGGAFTFATASGTSKSIAANDVIKFVAPSSADATAANCAITVRGTK